MSIDDVIEELKFIYKLTLRGEVADYERVSKEVIETWTINLSVSRSDLYDSIALYLAHAFHEQRFPFIFCDAIVNDIAGMIFSSQQELPDLFWDVFLAFDAGEYSRSRNRNENPVEI
jgi:hypothetical protein